MTMSVDLAEAGRHARFEAVRRRVFAEIKTMTARWRLQLVVPFHLIVLGLLAARGFPAGRLAIQAASSCTIVLGFALLERRNERTDRALLFVLGVAMLVAVANSGGLASPILISVIPFYVAVAMDPALENRRRHFVVLFALVFVAMAALSHSFALPAPLGPRQPFATVEYVTIALISSLTSLIALYKLGSATTAAYERITLELAERREELCDENEGRTRALEGIAARLAHEVKNPLAAIKGLSQHVAQSAEDPKVKERLTIVAQEADRLREIVDGFLSFSRGLDELHLAPTRPYEIARELSLLLETRAADMNITLDVRGSRDLSLDADGKKLRQALLNLVLNAMQASARDAVVTLEVAKNCSDGGAVLRVIDRGAGMSPDVLERIARPYFTTKEGGSGLGIAIARGIVEQHGGSLRFESAVGHGTTATVTLPAQRLPTRAKLPMACDILERTTEHHGAPWRASS
jgi:signal transduction histidine kinase